MAQTRSPRSGFIALLTALVALSLVASSCATDGTAEDSGGSDSENTTEEASQGDSDADDGVAADGDEPDSDDPDSGDDADADEAGDDDLAFSLTGELPISTDEMNALVAFVEDTTGRPFTTPPEIVVQSEADFEAGLAESTVEDEAEFAEDAELAARAYQAIGFSDLGAADLAENVKAIVSDSDLILGYYDPEADALFVPEASEGNQAFSSLMVHELVHALDDQYVDLQALLGLGDDDEGSSEAFFAAQSVVEGRAETVAAAWDRENDYVALPGSVPDGIDQVPPVLLVGLGLPYEFGAEYISRNGGPAGTWDLLENLPTSSEQIVVTSTPASEAIVDVSDPVAEGPELDRDDFGAVDLLLLGIGFSLTPDPSLALTSLTAADGWAGGEMVVWGDESESCVRVNVAADSDRDLDEIEALFTAVWAAQGGDRTVEEADGIVTATACAPYLP